MQLDVKLLGKTEVKLGEEIVDFPYQKVEALFYYLVVEKKISRIKIASFLWGNMPDSKAKKNLRNALYQLKKSLVDDVFKKNGSSTLLLNQEKYNFRIDLEQFLESSSLEKALSYYKGDFLSEFILKNSSSFNDWIIENRNYYQQIYIDKLKEKIKLLEEESNIDKAIKYLKKLINVDEFNEKAYRKLMEFYHKKGQSAKAIQIYKDLTKILEEELGINPDNKTLNLLQKIKNEKKIEVTKNKNLDFTFRKEEIENLIYNLRHFKSGKKAYSYFISGEAGIGKTTLLKKFLDKSKLDDLCVLQTNCFQGEERYIFNPLKKIVKQLEEKLDLDELEINYPWKKVLSILFPSLFVNSNLGNKQNYEFDSLQYQSALKALLYLLQTAAQKKKLILIFEDLQWSDEKSLLFIKQLIQENKNNNILVLVTSRINRRDKVLNEFTSLKRQNHLKEMKLSRLNYDEVKTFVDRTMPDNNFDEEIYSDIHRETEGNTFFLVELLRLFKEKNRERALSEFIQTEGCQNILQNKISNISEKAKKLLMLAAVCYKDIDYDLLSSISGMDDFELIENLEELQNYYILEENKDGNIQNVRYWFVHSKLKEYVYNQISNSRLKLLHRRIAGYLENNIENINSSRERFTKLIYHYSRAGNKIKKLEYLIKEAETYFKQTHKLFPIIHDNNFDKKQIMFLKKEDAKKYLIEIKKSFKEVAKSNNYQDKLEELRMKYLYISSRYYLCQGKYDIAINHIKNMLKKAEELKNTELLIEGYQELAGFGIQKENSELIANNARKIISLAQNLDKNELAGAGYRYLGVSKLYKKNFLGAKNNFKKSLNMFEKAERFGRKYKINMAGIFNYLGEVERYRSNFNKAFEFYNKGIDCYKEHEVSHGLGILYTNLGQLYYNQNQIVEAKIEFNNAIRIFNKLNTIWGYLSIAYSYKALIKFYDGDYQKSNDLLLKAEKILDNYVKKYWQGILFRVKAEISYNLEKGSEIWEKYDNIDPSKQEYYLDEAYEIFKNVGTLNEQRIIKSFTSL